MGQTSIMKKGDNRIAGMRNEAVQKATGKGWSGWFAVLDKARAISLTHKEIATILREKHNLSMWWSQQIAVGYEQERGMRKVHQQPEGFEISKSKTLPVSPLKAFKAWNDKKARDKWLGENITIRKATPGKSIRITWIDKETNVDVNFYPKDKNRCQVSVQHSRLSDAAVAEKMKSYWAGKLEKLREYLGG
jgi:uncharacterized protein YndB with AHSA1/START domain